MSSLYVWFWSAMILASIAWYAILLFYLGIKGAIEIQRMKTKLGKRRADETGAP